PSKISPTLLKPCILCYTDHTGERHKITGIPAERYLGNEDARGGYGALQYEGVMGQIYDHMAASNSYDPEYPPFFLLHSDGDNHGGGAEGYYTSNTGGLVNMCQTNPKFQLITIKDYLEKFGVDPANIVHVEPGAWAGADNGDHLFTKWFSRAEEDYSPDLNSWAVLTAFQNIVHTLEDNGCDEKLLNEMKRLLYTAETSCYWYWTGQEIWDGQVTAAFNKSYEMAKSQVDSLISSGADKTAPTIFTPWARPANPGGQDWGNNCLVDAAEDAVVRTFVYDISGVKDVVLHLSEVGGSTTEIKMENLGPYPSRTNPAATGSFYKAVIPKGSGNMRYYIRAEDEKGNTATSHVERIFVN
ncbi:MAG: glycosyl hydrolase family 57, partial [Planctomycetota bacterium]